MLYLVTPSNPDVRAAMRAGDLGQIVTHLSANRLEPGVPWALDNGCFSDRWQPDAWLAYLERLAGVPDCLFAVVPDVVGDAAATDELWPEWSARVRSLGYTPAYVTQNGCDAIPADAGAMFTGGDDEWKLSGQARQLMRGALGRGLWCHMGRVNTLRRLRVAFADGYDSVDGTCVSIAPTENLPRILRYLRTAAHPVLPFDDAPPG